MNKKSVLNYWFLKNVQTLDSRIFSKNMWHILKQCMSSNIFREESIFDERVLKHN